MGKPWKDERRKGDGGRARAVTMRGPFDRDWLDRYDAAQGIPVLNTGSAIESASLLAPRCVHDGQVAAIILTDGRKLYGAQGGTLARPETPLDHLDLIVDCAGLVAGPLAARRTFVQSATGRKFGSLKLAMLPDVLRLDWPDMTAPSHVGIRFWQKLLALLPLHTAVCCVGGHGRTGTALASLLVAGGMDGQTAIDRVRVLHCEKAIETKAQEDYIRGLADRRDRTAKTRG